MPDLLLQFKRLKVPTVTTIHTTIQGQRHGTKSSEMSFWSLEFSEKLTYLTYPFLRLAETVYFSKERYYITVSKWMREQIVKQYPKIDSSSISVIYNSVDIEKFSPGRSRSPPERDVILFTGRLIATKGIRYLVEAMPKVLREYPDALFIFIGPGNSLPYQRRLRELGIPEKNFMFLGYLKESSDLVEYYRSSSVFVAPTLYENLPIRVLEAMACGVPVVASNVCAIPEAIDNGINGILIQPGSIDELIDAICRLLGDPSLRQKMGDNARRTVLEKFNWKINAIKTVEVYQQILDSFDYKSRRRLN
jgi:glycosyltransferase involved in cell wall biosynthesis